MYYHTELPDICIAELQWHIPLVCMPLPIFYLLHEIIVSFIGYAKCIHSCLLTAAEVRIRLEHIFVEKWYIDQQFRVFCLNHEEEVRDILETASELCPGDLERVGKISTRLVNHNQGQNRGRCVVRHTLHIH